MPRTAFLSSPAIPRLRSSDRSSASLAFAAPADLTSCHLASARQCCLSITNLASPTKPRRSRPRPSGRARPVQSLLTYPMLPLNAPQNLASHRLRAASLAGRTHQIPSWTDPSSPIHSCCSSAASPFETSPVPGLLLLAKPCPSKLRQCCLATRHQNQPNLSLPCQALPLQSEPVLPFLALLSSPPPSRTRSQLPDRTKPMMTSREPPSAAGLSSP